MGCMCGVCMYDFGTHLLRRIFTSAVIWLHLAFPKEKFSQCMADEVPSRSNLEVLSSALLNKLSDLEDGLTRRTCRLRYCPILHGLFGGWGGGSLTTSGK